MGALSCVTQLRLDVCFCQRGFFMCQFSTHLGWKEGQNNNIVRFVVDAHNVSRSPSPRFQKRRKKAPVAPSLTVQKPRSQSTANRQQHSRPKGQQGCPVSAPLPLTFQSAPWLGAWQVEPRAKEGDGRWQRLDGSHDPQRRFSLFHLLDKSRGELLPPPGRA